MSEKEKPDFKKSLYISCLISVLVVVAIGIYYLSEIDSCTKQYEFVTKSYELWLDDKLVDEDGKRVIISQAFFENLFSEYNDKCPDGKKLEFAVASPFQGLIKP